MASFRQRDDKCQAQVRRVGHRPISKSFPNKTLAMKWARMIEREIDTGDFIDTRGTRTVTLSVLLERYRAEKTPLKRGADDESWRLGGIISRGISSRSLSEISPEIAADYRDSRLVDVKPATVAREIRLMAQVVDVACREWGLKLRSNPFRQIDIPTSNDARNRRLETGEAERLMASLDKSRSNWFKPIVELALETAMRRGELLSLLWSNIDLKQSIAYLPTTKNGEQRTVPLSRHAISVLRELPRSIDGQVFPISHYALRHGFQRALKRANITNLRFHDLRHEAASRLFEKGLNPMEVATITGHKSMQMLSRYTHLRAVDLVVKLL